MIAEHRGIADAILKVATLAIMVSPSFSMVDTRTSLALVGSKKLVSLASKNRIRWLKLLHDAIWIQRSSNLKDLSWSGAGIIKADRVPTNTKGKISCGLKLGLGSDQAK
jgi:hypothetical protein